MNVFKTLIATIAIAAGCASSAAQATVIDFNGLANNSLMSLGSNSTPAGGMTFKGANASYFMSSSWTGGDQGASAYNGTDFYMSFQNFTITSQFSTPFSVNSLDLAQWYDGSGVSQVTLVGTVAGGAPISQTLNLDTRTNASKVTGNDFTTFNLTGFNNLTSLTVSHNGSTYLALDNLVVNAVSVPEPSSIALFGLALAGVAVMRRRRA